MSQSPGTGFGSRCELQMPIEFWIFLFSTFFHKNGLVQEESQHILTSILIQDGE